METNLQKERAARQSRAFQKSSHPQHIKTQNFPQEPLLQKAHRQCVHAYDADPSPVNRAIVQAVASKWHGVFCMEVL